MYSCVFKKVKFIISQLSAYFNVPAYNACLFNAVLFNVCLLNANFLPLTFANALSWVIGT